MILNVYFFVLFQTFSLAGLGAGVTEAILVNPFEVVKVTQQSNREKVQLAPNSLTVTKEIVREHVSFLVLTFEVSF